MVIVIVVQVSSNDMIIFYKYSDSYGSVPQPLHVESAAKQGFGGVGLLVPYWQLCSPKQLDKNLRHYPSAARMRIVLITHVNLGASLEGESG